MPEHGEPVVVELGAGTGVFTSAIQARLGSRGRQVAVEANPRLADRLSARYPTVEVLTADAAHLPQLLSERHVQRVDVIVSGLPWAAFPAASQRDLLRAITTVMSPGAVFTTFGYALARGMPAARAFRTLLADRFEEVVVGQSVLGNLPPAFVYHARRPR